MKWSPTGAGCAVIVLGALAAYHNSLTGAFLFDDPLSIVHNPTIRHLWPIGPVLSPPYDYGRTVGGRPILNLTLAINYAISGTNVWSYHALNLLIHMLAGLTLFGIARRTLVAGVADPGSGLSEAGYKNSTLPAFCIALLWTVHPLQTEAVTYVIQRAESLMGLFYLLTIYCFIRCAGNVGEKGRAASSAMWATLSVVSCLLGMGTKEVMVSAPVIVVLYDRTFLSGSFREAWRRHGRVFLCLAATWIPLAYLVVSTGGNRGGSSGVDTGVSWWSYELTQFPAIVRYLRLGVWPHPLIFDYGLEWVRNPPSVVADAACVLALAAATLYALFHSGRQSRILKTAGFLGAFFFAILAPTSLVTGTRQTIVEHRMYLALIPVIAMVVFGVEEAACVLSSEGKKRAAFSTIPVVALAAIFIFLTIHRNPVYLGDLALWTDTVAKRPNNPYAHDNLGTALADKPGRQAAAAAQYEEALSINPSFAEAHYNLGRLLANEPGRQAAAIAHYEAAVRISPDYAEALNNLGLLLATQPGRQAEAIADFEAALRRKPDYAEAHNNLANLLAGLPGRQADAIAHYETALRLKPDYAEVHYDLAALLATQPGRLGDAIAHYKTALRLKPDYAEASFNLGSLLASQPGKQEEAIADFEATLRLKPDYAEAHNNLAILLATQPGRQADAIAHLETALRLKPDLADAHYNLAGLLAGQPGRQADAIAHLKAALRLKPDFAKARLALQMLQAGGP